MSDEGWREGARRASAPSSPRAARSPEVGVMAVPWPLALLSFWQTLSSRALVQDASRGVLFSLLFFCFLNLFWAAHRLTPAESTGSCGCTQVEYPVTREIHCGVFPPTGDARGGRPVPAARRGVERQSRRSDFCQTVRSVLRCGDLRAAGFVCYCRLLRRTRFIVGWQTATPE